ncbi:MAG: hypothetical protein ACUVWP_03240 [bacterium]
MVIKISESGKSVITIKDQPVLNLELETNDGIITSYTVGIDSNIPRALVQQS